MTRSELEQLTRSELESAYIASVPALHRESSARLISAFSDDYLRSRLAPPTKMSRRGRRIARHCNDEGES